MRRKKLFLIPSIFAVIFSVCALSSCGDCIGTNGGNSSIETKISVDIEKDVYDVKLGEIATSTNPRSKTRAKQRVSKVAPQITQNSKLITLTA